MAVSLRARRRDEALVRLLEIVQRRLETGEHFNDLGVEELAAEAGISRTTFYVYFEDKNDLLRAWFASAIDEINVAVADWWSVASAPTRDEIRDRLAAIVHTYQPHTTLMAASHDAIGYDDVTRELVDQVMRDWIDGLRCHIEDGQRAGFIDARLLPAETAYWLHWMVERGLHHTPPDADAASLERLIDAYTTIVWNTLYATAVRRES